MGCRSRSLGTTSADRVARVSSTMTPCTAFKLRVRRAVRWLNHPDSSVAGAEVFFNTGWDFVDETANGTEDIWWILEGQGYPRLCWELITDDALRK